MMPTITRESSYQGAFEVFEAKDAAILVGLFLYRLALADQCPLSWDLETKLNVNQKDKLFAELLKVANAEEADFVFASMLINRLARIEELGLSDETLSADKAKGFFQKSGPEEKAKEKVHRFDSMMRHMRNSIAHGRVCRHGSLILLEDWGGKQLTARLFIDDASLLSWAAIVTETAEALI